MRKLTIILALCFITQSIFAQTNAFSLKEAINFAIQNDKSIKNAQLNIQSAQAQSNEIRSIGMPKLSAKANYQYFIEIPTSLVPAKFFNPQAADDEFAELQFGTANNLTASLDFSMLLFDGSFLVALESAKIYKDYVALQVKQAERSVEEKVTEAYIATLVFDFTKTTFEKNMKNLEQLIKETKEMFKAGFMEELDIDRLEYSMQSLKSQLDNLERQEEQVKDLLKFTMSFPLDQNIEVTDNIDLLLANEFAANDSTLSLSDRPEIAVVNKALELSDMDIKQYKMGYYPSLAGFATYQQSVQGSNLFTNSNAFPTSIVGLQLNVPIFDGFEKRSKIEKATVAKEVAINQKSDLIRAINLEINMAKIAIKNALERLKNTKKSIDLAEKIYNKTRIKYKEGVGSSFEIIQAEQDLYQSQNAYQQALFDVLKAKADLKLALGK